MLVLLGCTASGKTAAALELAPRLGAEILSIDSMQVYRGMDIGTAKPTAAELAVAQHHMIDVVDPHEAFSVARYVEMADAAIRDITSRGKQVLAVGGTPLYVMGLLYGMFEGPAADEGFRAKVRARAARDGTAVLHAELGKVDAEAAGRIHPNDLKRIERALEVWHATGRPLSEQQGQWAGPMRFNATLIGIQRDREDLGRRINQRVRTMIEAGLVEEVRRLAGSMGEQARQALGYAEILAHLRGEMSLEDAVERIKINTRRFAKHQRTWFRRFKNVEWVEESSQLSALSPQRE